MNALTHSALYHGEVQHRRFSPRAHAFNYPISLLYLDLAEEQALRELSPLCGVSGKPLSFRHTDYLPDLTGQGISLTEAVRQRCAATLGFAPQGPVRLLTQPRSFGLWFNPLSVFYLFEADQRLGAIVLEVCSTPWRERAYYALACSDNGHQGGHVAKAMHVSPFLPRDMHYHMRFSQPVERLGLHIANHPDGQPEHKQFDATLKLSRQPLTRASVHAYLRRYPLNALTTLWRIHWQALRLLIKRIPITDHQALTDIPHLPLQRKP